MSVQTSKLQRLHNLIISRIHCGFFYAPVANKRNVHRKEKELNRRNTLCESNNMQQKKDDERPKAGKRVQAYVAAGLKRESVPCCFTGDGLKRCRVLLTG